MTHPLLKLSNLSVSFGGNHALKNVSLDIQEGEIVGLLGHNGAGKSTLVNVATGALHSDAGEIELNKKPLNTRSNPAEFEAAGIKVIHQTPALSDFVSVADNIAVGRSVESKGRDAREAYAEDALSLLGSNIDPGDLVSDLSFGEKQIVDLARALSTELNVLFLDEPTGALGQQEADRLHDLVRDLANERKAIIYVSHRLKDILSVCTRIVVLRAGEVVLDRPAESFTLKELANALAPDSHKERAVRSIEASAPESLRIKRSNGQELSFKRGEIVGLFGMAAGPQFRLLQSIYGLNREDEIQLDQDEANSNAPAQSIKQGIYYLSENRGQEAALEHLSIVDNLIAPWMQSEYSRFGLLETDRPLSTYEHAKGSLNIKAEHPSLPITSLSGGNAQKVMVARWLYGPKPKVLMLAQPTQGIDVGARNDILMALQKFADEGVTILVASSESDEIELLCDRAIVCQGSIWPELERTEEWSETLLKHLVSTREKESMK